MISIIQYSEREELLIVILFGFILAVRTCDTRQCGKTKKINIIDPNTNYNYKTKKTFNSRQGLRIFQLAVAQWLVTDLIH